MPQSCNNTRLCIKALVCVLACLCGTELWGLDPAKTLRQHVLRTWTSEQGLPQNAVRAMLQTKDGFLWIGTQGGLARFDGAGFVLFKAGMPNSIPGESITGLAEDRDGGLWISSSGGLSRYRNGRFQTFHARDGLPENSIWRIAADPAGGVWGVTWNSLLFHFDGKTVRRYPSPLLGHPEAVNALLEDGNGTLWMATFHGLFALGRDGLLNRFSKKDGLAGDRVYALALNRRNELWTAGDGGLTRRTADGFAVTAVPGLPCATLLAFDPNNQDDALWTGSTGRGLWQLNPTGTHRLRAADGLVGDEVYLLYFSREGSLWLGANNGLSQLSDGAVTSYGTGEGLPESTMGMQRAQGPDGELWFGHDGRMFQVRDEALRSLPGAVEMALLGRNHAQKPSRMEAISVRVRSTDPGDRGFVLSDRYGRAVLSDGTRERTLPRIPWASVGTVLIDRNGTIWTGGSEDGVRAYTAHTPPRSFTTANGLDDNNVSALAQDVSGSIWVGTLSGLNRIRNGVVTHMFSCAKVTSIDPSADGSVWVSSESGLLYVPPTPAPVRLFTQRDNLPTDLIEGVADDAQGHVWLGTQQGVVRVNKNDLLGSGVRRGAPVIFGMGDGLRNDQLRIDSLFRSRRGDIWFLTLRELAMIDPRETQVNRLAPIILDRVELDDKEAAYAPASSFTVPSGRHRLRIRYTLPEFRIPGRLRFRYRLEGWDKDWIDAGNLREATYTGIPPGRYTFLVAGSDGYGHWRSGASTLSLRVVPRFYQTGWCRILAIALVGACAWQGHRLRVHRVSARLHARMQERTRIARELHDTLLQGVLGVSMQMYAASCRPPAPAMAASLLENASRRLREIAEQSRRTVEDLRSPDALPESLESTLAVLLRDLTLHADVQPRINTVGAPIDLRPPVRAEVGQIAREAIANAVRHSGATHIRVDVVYQPSHFFLSVSDDGLGMDPEILESGRPGHWGLPGMRERVAAIGGRLRIVPNAPRGTVVEISMRGSIAYVRKPRTPSFLPWSRVSRRFGRPGEPVTDFSRSA